MSLHAIPSFGRDSRMIKARRDRRHKIAVLEQLEQRIVLDTSIKLVPVVTLTGLASVDYLGPSSSLVTDVNVGTQNPESYARVQANGTVSTYASPTGVTGENHLAVTHAGNPGGWTVGDLYAGNGQVGQIMKISNNGSTITNPWVTLPGETGVLHDSPLFDTTGLFGGNMIAVTYSGGVWKVTPQGTATKITQLSLSGSDFDSSVIIPANPSRYGPLAGKLVVFDESSTNFYTVDPAGNTASFNLGIVGPGAALMIPAGQNFFIADTGGNRLLGADWSGFSSMAGDILVVRDNPAGGSGFVRVYWDINQLQLVAQPLTFAPGSATSTK